MPTREAKLARTFVEVADTLTADFDVVDLHTLVATRCVEIFTVDAAGLMVVSPAGDLRVMAASDDATRTLELFELQAQEGPCYDCFQNGEPIWNQSLAAARQRWPRFAPLAMAHGFATAHAVPMRLREQVIGAVNLFQASGSLEPDDRASIQALAGIATIALLHHRASVQAQTLNDQLDRALTSRVVIEQAKGVVAGRSGLTVHQAFNRLRGYARSHNRRLADVAADVVDGALTTADITSPPAR